MHFATLKCTNVFSPIYKGKGAVPVEFAILPFTGVFLPIGMGIGAYAIAPVIKLAFTGRLHPSVELNRRRAGMQRVASSRFMGISVA